MSPRSDPPTLDVERALAGEVGPDAVVIGVDEVGRGAIAGPVAVGLGVLARPAIQWGPAPQRLRDSKLLRPTVREDLIPEIGEWLDASAVGMVSAEDIDVVGIIAALRLAAQRALAEVLPAFGHRPIVVLLDGSHDWIAGGFGPGVRVVVRTKADRDCASVAAASVVAKVRRDALMTRLHDEAPVYGWSGNMGYASEGHRAALVADGPSGWHRVTWLGKILGGLDGLDAAAAE